MICKSNLKKCTFYLKLKAYPFFKLSKSTIFKKCKLILNLIAATRCEKIWDRAMFSTVLHPLFF